LFEIGTDGKNGNAPKSQAPGPDAVDLGFHALYGEVSPILMRVAYRIAGTQEAAEDLVHEAFIRYWEKKIPFPNRNEAKFWLIRVVKNAALNYAKRSGRERKAYDRALREIGPESDNGEKALIREESRAEVIEALDKLPGPLRETLVLKEYGELNYKEIGRVLGISEANVKVRVFRAREKLAVLLKEAGYVS
jgi:RNA polymerase sigma-70 factor (ECF subfamily)